jgi:hypothetical protein
MFVRASHLAQAMASILLNDESARIAIGDLIATAVDPLIEIRNAEGAVIAQIILHPGSGGNGIASAVASAESQIDELRRRRAVDRSKDVTTAEMLGIAEESVAGKER